jgi:hypothetical protein
MCHYNVLVIEHWNLRFICYLVLEIWNFATVSHRFIRTYGYWVVLRLF